MAKGGCVQEQASLPKGGAKVEERPKTQVNAAPVNQKQQLPMQWWNRGGLRIGYPVAVLNTTVSVIYLLKDCSEGQIRLFISLLVLNTSLALVVHQMRTFYCAVVGPLYYTSLILAFFIGSPIKLLTLSLALAIYKIAICMSTCLHRYASHTAFKCGPVTQLFLSILGCLAYQGGPIWWASMHRCHHKYCDKLREAPRSALGCPGRHRTCRGFFCGTPGRGR